MFRRSKTIYSIDGPHGTDIDLHAKPIAGREMLWGPAFATTLTISFKFNRGEREKAQSPDMKSLPIEIPGVDSWRMDTKVWVCTLYSISTKGSDPDFYICVFQFGSHIPETVSPGENLGRNRKIDAGRCRSENYRARECRIIRPGKQFAIENFPSLRHILLDIGSLKHSYLFLVSPLTINIQRLHASWLHLRFSC